MGMTQLVSAWLPSLEGVVAKLERGAKVADVGCGVGASTIRIAQAFPRVRLFGYDTHPSAIEIARQRATEAGVADRVTFDVASPTDFPGRQYDLVCHFARLHAAENASGTAQRVKDALASGGTWMIVESFAAGERLHTILIDAGFTRVRRAMETSVDLVLEARI
jgi:cyclopropane fatty-acyl-phospholipid synthase-like methyltransferase